ncbi:hypothetical protein, partial [Bordetella pertussis]|uniref:hypothetical protein n=1 Tax=Bordetella pertussis TaxID=520 RepID=UPI0012B16416
GGGGGGGGGGRGDDWQPKGAGAHESRLGFPVYLVKSTVFMARSAFAGQCACSTALRAAAFECTLCTLWRVIAVIDAIWRVSRKCAGFAFLQGRPAGWAARQGNLE